LLSPTTKTQTQSAPKKPKTPSNPKLRLLNYTK